MSSGPKIGKKYYVSESVGSSGIGIYPETLYVRAHPRNVFYPSKSQTTPVLYPFSHEFSLLARYTSA